MIRVETQALPDGITPAVAAWWRSAVSAHSDPPSGTDMTATPEWSLALARAFLPGAGANLLVAFDRQSEVAALLPVYRRDARRFGAFGSTVALLTDLYGGRTALLARTQCSAEARALFDRLDEAYTDWSCLEMTLVDGNADSTRFLQAIQPHAAAVVAQAREPSPYIRLPERFDDYFSTLKPNFRTEVRRGERRLSEAGRLERRLFTAPDEVAPLWQAVCRIERESWKEVAGTSITTNPSQERFYEEFLPICAAAGQLLTAVLYLDGRPIAHQLCLQRDGIAAILKMSYVEDLKRFYPATVLLSGYLRDIIERGVRYLDFMGVCDEFKMRWTSLTYGRTTHLIFRDSLAGRWAHARMRGAGRIASIRERIRLSPWMRSPSGQPAGAGSSPIL